ncbi:MAG: ComEC/Rec2 family competence protein, partial [Candidatus Nanopelagicaceae bacterium]
NKNLVWFCSDTAMNLFREKLEDLKSQTLDYSTDPTENNRSVVAVVEIANLKILITGDIEPGAQQEIAKDLASIDVIKVPHHGSRSQEPSLFNGASIFLISVGKNSYGHPDQGLISMLSSMGRVFRSDRDGAISLGWRLDDLGEPIFSARQLRKDWWRISWH